MPLVHACMHRIGVPACRVVGGEFYYISLVISIEPKPSREQHPCFVQLVILF